MSTGKLVRDKIPQIIKQNDGINPKVRILNNEEYYTELNKKLLEEVHEYLESQDVLELVDIYEVLLAILSYQEIDFPTFETLRQDKVHKRGAFVKRLYLESEKNK